MCLFWYLPFEDNIVNGQTILHNFDTKPQIDSTGTTSNGHLMIYVELTQRFKCL